MLKIKISLLKKMNAFIGVLLALLGFACSKTDSGDDEVYVEYGVPSAAFIIKGTVKSASLSTPLTDIQVIAEYDTVYTDESGNYQVTIYDYPLEQSILVEYKDIDGTNNGEYENQDTTVVFSDPEFTGGDGIWYHGSITKTVDINLEEKE